MQLWRKTTPAGQPYIELSVDAFRWDSYVVSGCRSLPLHHILCSFVPVGGKWIQIPSRMSKAVTRRRLLTDEMRQSQLRA